MKRYCTPQQISVIYPFMKPTAIREFIFNAEVNGLSPYLRRIGRKIIIDQDGFEKWFEDESENHSAKKKCYNRNIHKKDGLNSNASITRAEKSLKDFEESSDLDFLDRQEINRILDI